MNNYSVTFYTRDERPVAWDEQRLGSRFFRTGEAGGMPAMYCWARAADPSLIAPALAPLYPDATSMNVLSEPGDFDPGDRFPGIRPFDVGGPTRPSTSPAPGGRPVSGPRP